MVAQARRGRVEGRLRPGREDDELLVVIGAGRAGGRSLLQNHVRVRPADAERADAGAARRTLWGLPRLQGGDDPERGGLEIELRVRRGEVEARGDRLVVEGQRSLDQPRDPRGGVEMADVALDRADRADAGFGAPPARNAWVSPAISIGSPSGVAVPCAST